jgi:hypothetical protein
MFKRFEIPLSNPVGGASGLLGVIQISMLIGGWFLVRLFLRMYDKCVQEQMMRSGRKGFWLSFIQDWGWCAVIFIPIVWSWLIFSERSPVRQGAWNDREWMIAQVILTLTVALITALLVLRSMSIGLEPDKFIYMHPG